MIQDWQGATEIFFANEAYGKYKKNIKREKKNEHSKGFGGRERQCQTNRERGVDEGDHGRTNCADTCIIRFPSSFVAFSGAIRTTNDL